MNPVRRGADSTQVGVGKRPSVSGWRLSRRRLDSELRRTEPIAYYAVLARPQPLSTGPCLCERFIFTGAASLTSSIQGIQGRGSHCAQHSKHHSVTPPNM